MAPRRALTGLRASPAADGRARNGRGLRASPAADGRAGSGGELRASPAADGRAGNGRELRASPAADGRAGSGGELRASPAADGRARNGLLRGSFRVGLRALLRTHTVGLALVLHGLLPGTAGAQASSELVAAGFSRPLYAVSPPGDSLRLFVVEQGSGDQASIHILDLAMREIRSPPFLTLSGLDTVGERGLLGLAFHPGFASNRRFFVHYTEPGQAPGEAAVSVVAELLAREDDPDQADPSSLLTVLRFSQPASNHNGGWLGFGPDGYLYVASGDGGDANDLGPGHTAGIGNAQDLTDNLLGKMLRLDVDADDFPLDSTRNYAIPVDNPFVDDAGDDEIWAYGLRNPWRPSFDRATGDLYLADVGQNHREEVSFQPATSPGGENYGWRLREGTIATPTPPQAPVGGAPPPGAVEPIYDYAHESGPFGGSSVTGGYVYRGPATALRGLYFFADFVSDEIWSFRFDGSDPADFDGSNVLELTRWTDVLAPAQGDLRDISSFGEDGLGHLYLLDRTDGEVFRIVPEPTGAIALLAALAQAWTLSVRRTRKRRKGRAEPDRTRQLGPA